MVLHSAPVHLSYSRVQQYRKAAKAAVGFHCTLSPALDLEIVLRFWNLLAWPLTVWKTTSDLPVRFPSKIKLLVILSCSLK